MITKKQLTRMKVVLMGGEGSGNFDHAGRPGKVGGSASGESQKQYMLPPGTSIKWGYAGDPNNFQITRSGARAVGILENDFPNDRSSPTRGEIWYIEVPKEGRKKGLGYSLAKDLLGIMKSKGMETVNMSGVTEEGRGLIEKLIKNGDIGKAIRTSKSGKSEYPIL